MSTQGERLGRIMEELGLSAVEVSAAGGFDRTYLSHIRSGRRAVASGKPAADKIAQGLILAAKDKGVEDKLYEMACSAAKDLRSGTMDGRCALMSYLFEEDGEGSKAEAQTGQNLSYGQKIALLKQLAGVSNAWLAKKMNVDPSIISRYTAGSRTPAPGSSLAQRIARVFWEIFEKKGLLKSLEERLLRELDMEGFIKWLSGDDGEDWSAAVEFILDGINDIDQNDSSGGKGSAQQETNKFVSRKNGRSDLKRSALSDKRTIYKGIEGLREAVARFLLSAIASGSRMLYLYSDEDMGWMTGGDDFFDRWTCLMGECARAGMRIRIVHNIDRNIVEMASAISSWLPLYASGVMDPWYCKSMRGERFLHSLFICENVAAVSGFYFEGTQESERLYRYDTEALLLDAHMASYEKLISNSARLMQVKQGAPIEREPDIVYKGIRVYLMGRSAAIYISNGMELKISHPLMYRAFKNYAKAHTHSRLPC